MNRANLFFLTACIGFLAAGSVAVAQDDGPSLVLSGDEITVTEDGDETTYTVATPGSVDVFVLQCPGAGGSVDALIEGEATALCDLGNLISATPGDDGTFEAMFEGVDIDACGLVFGAGDTAATEAAAVLLGVEEPGDPAVCAVVENAGYAADDEAVANTGDDAGGDSAGGDDAEVAGVSTTADEAGALATTGLETGWLVGIALVVSLVGGLILFEGRRATLRRSD